MWKQFLDYKGWVMRLRTGDISVVAGSKDSVSLTWAGCSSFPGFSCCVPAAAGSAAHLPGSEPS